MLLRFVLAIIKHLQAKCEQLIIYERNIKLFV